MGGGSGGLGEVWGWGEKVPARCDPFGNRRIEQEIPGGCDREFHEVFLLFDPTPPEDLRLQKGEVEAVLRIRLRDARALDERASVPAEEYAAGSMCATRVRLSDFVPNEDDYLRRAAGAARRLLAGESPWHVF